jgi:hypothetical protein
MEEFDILYWLSIYFERDDIVSEIEMVQFYKEWELV